MKHTKFITSLALLIILISHAETLFAQKRKIPQRRSASVSRAAAQISPELQKRVETFQFAWQTIRDNYFDQTFSGLDWETIRREYEPRVLKTTSDAQLHDLLEEMIGRLDRSHFAIIPPQVFEDIERTKAAIKAREEEKASDMSADGEAAETVEDFSGDDYAAFGIGVELRLMNNQFVVTRVEKNSAAERSRLKTGYVIQKINDISLDELLKRIDLYYKNVKNVKRHLPEEIVTYILNGEEDSSVELAYLDETDQPKEIEIRRERLRGTKISIGGNYPEQLLNYQSESLGDEVGYIKFDVFAVPVIEKFCASLTEFKDKKAIILDLRGNTGGILGTLTGLGGMLTETSIDFGTSIYKIGSESLFGTSKAKNFKGRLIVLVDNQSASAAEVFAAALQENKRALVVGERTAGEALPSISVDLPTGAVMVYPIANFKTRNGNYLEGKGVEPNYAVALDRKSLLAGNDAQIEIALRLIKEDKDFPKPEPRPTSFSAPAPPPAAKPTPAPPAAKSGASNSANIVVKPPPPPARIEEKVGKDEKSLQVFADFVQAIGGEAAFAKINSYALKGTSDVGRKGMGEEYDLSVYKQKPDKYRETFESEVTGEITEIYAGDKYILQSDYGISREITLPAASPKADIFSPVFNVVKKDFFKYLKHQGVFDRQGRKAHVIDARTKEDVSVALAFDVETKMLVSYVVYYYVFSLGDYRKIGDVQLPFLIERENAMTVKVDEIKLNPVLDETVFRKKENCFDRAN